MKQLIEQIEEMGARDAIVFGWSNMRRKAKNLNDEAAILQLVKALINSKNLAIRVLDKHQNDSKVIRLKK
jgi:hypothetical protein